MYLTILSTSYFIEAVYDGNRYVSESMINAEQPIQLRSILALVRYRYTSANLLSEIQKRILVGGSAKEAEKVGVAFTPSEILNLAQYGASFVSRKPRNPASIRRLVSS